MSFEESAQNSYNQYFGWNMKLNRSTLILSFVLICVPLFVYPNDSSKEGSSASANLELGADSLQRRYFRPRLRFGFPFDWGNAFVEMNYYQRINGQLKGEVDFWILGGLLIKMSETLRLEASLNHMSRHITSVTNPAIFEVNELLGRIWLKTPNIHLGLGGGGYIGGNDAYDNIFVLNLGLPKILDTEFSVVAEAKLINLNRILYDFEFFVSLSQSVDLFVRNTKHYELDTTTYLGMRLKSGGSTKIYIKKLKLRAGTLPSNDRYKLIANNEFYLEFYQSPKRRLQLLLNSRVPILNNEKILGTFRPEEIAYPMLLEYERRVTDKLLAIGYIGYRAEMPLDIDRSFSSTLGFGIGISNQSFFEKLDNNFRFAISGGRNFTHAYDFDARIGINTVGRPLNIGADAKIRINSEESISTLEIFMEFGGEIKTRVFFCGDHMDFFDYRTSLTNWQIGFELVKWF